MGMEKVRWDREGVLREKDYVFLFFFPVALRHNASHGLLILEVSRSHTTMHHSR